VGLYPVESKASPESARLSRTLFSKINLLLCNVNSADFERRFCAKRWRVQEILEALQAIDLYFKQRPDAVGKICFSGLNKICVTLQTIAYEYSADKAYQYFRMAESTVLDTVYHFERGLIATFGGSHLRVRAS
jgi:hypothetical protein